MDAVYKTVVIHGFTVPGQEYKGLMKYPAAGRFILEELVLLRIALYESSQRCGKQADEYPVPDVISAASGRISARMKRRRAWQRTSP